MAYFVGVLPITYLLFAIGLAIEHANRGSSFALVGIAAMWTGAVVVLGTQFIAAMAGAIGPGPVWIRLPVSLGCVAVLPLVALLGAATTGIGPLSFTWNVRPIMLLTPLMFFAAQLPFWIAVYLRGWTLVDERNAGVVESALPKVGVRGIMAATAVVAVVLCCAQFALRTDPENSLSPVNSVVALSLAAIDCLLAYMIAIPLVAFLLRGTITRRQIAAPVVVAAALHGTILIAGTLPFILMRSPQPGFEPWRVVLLITLVVNLPLAALQLTSLLGVLAFRAGGFRLVGKADLRKQSTPTILQRANSDAATASASLVKSALGAK